MRKRENLWLTVVLLVVGYSGYYLCRSSFSVAKPLLLEAFPNLTKTDLGGIASIGTLLYAIGKLIHGPMADRFGGKTMFVYGMIGAVLFSLMFSWATPPLFMLAWSGNRFVQSAGWGGMVRIVGKWATASKYGTVMAVISLSYLFGDFFSRLLLGWWVKEGATWNMLFLYSAIGLVMIAVPIVFLLSEQPSVAVEAESAQTATDSQPFHPLKDPRFILVCALSFCFTLLRETFNEWIPTLLTEQAKMPKSDATFASSLFPLLGGISVLGIGILSDRFASERSPLFRLRVVPAGLFLSAVLLALLAFLPSVGAPAYVVILSLCGLCLIGPYSLLAGATSLDFGGGKNSGKAVGLIDGIGYFGGILSGIAVGNVADRLGWSAALGILAAFAAVTALAMFVSLKLQLKKFANI